MGKEDLRSGLAGWIRDTREVAHDLVAPQPPPSETVEDRGATASNPTPTAPVQPESAAALLATLHSQIRAMAAQAHLLESLESPAEVAAKEALAQDLMEVARAIAPQITAPQITPQLPAAATSPAAPPPEEREGIASRVRPIAADSFHSEVLESEIPVLVELHLEGYRPCDEARLALAGVADLYAGPVEVRTLNVMEAEPEILPQIVKVGRDFFDRNLPKVLLYQHGAKLGELGGEIRAEDLAEMLRSNIED